MNGLNVYTNAIVQSAINSDVDIPLLSYNTKYGLRWDHLNSYFPLHFTMDRLCVVPSRLKKMMMMISIIVYRREAGVGQ